MRWRTLHTLLLMALFSAFAVAEARDAAPRFTATTLTDETFTNDSLKGKVALLQFWTTWCPYCRGEQSAVENIIHDFSGRGLVVVAVDVRESEKTVKKYLEGHPRSCHIVLTGNTNLVATFAPKGFPLYVLIDREGNIAGTQDGAAGESSLRDLLSRAGLGGSSSASDQRSLDPRPPHIISAKLAGVIPGGQNAPPSKSLPPTVFVLKSGEKLEVHQYTIMAGSLRITETGNQRSIPIAALDIKASIAANHERGIDLKIPTNQNEILLGH